MTVRQKPFLFLAGATAIDFLNTEIMSEGNPADLLEKPGDLDDWLVEAGLQPRRGTRPATPRSLNEVKELRRALRILILRMAGGHAPTTRDLAALNEALERAPGNLTMEKDGIGLRLRFSPRPASENDPMVLISRCAAEFLARADLSLIRSCGGRDCVLLFYDTTKSHTRRWCSMTSCGNRAKVAQHYRRSRTRKH